MTDSWSWFLLIFVLQTNEIVKKSYFVRSNAWLCAIFPLFWIRLINKTIYLIHSWCNFSFEFRYDLSQLCVVLKNWFVLVSMTMTLSFDDSFQSQCLEPTEIDCQESNLLPMIITFRRCDLFNALHLNRTWNLLKACASVCHTANAYKCMSLLLCVYVTANTPIQTKLNLLTSYLLQNCANWLQF